MQQYVAEAVTAAASVILEKMALNDEENLTEIKLEILKVMEYSGESVHLDPPADVNFNKNSVLSTQDPEPMEAQELETTSQADASNIIDLTNIENSKITEKTRVLCAEKNRIIETVVLSTHQIFFG